MSLGLSPDAVPTGTDTQAGQACYRRLHPYKYQLVADCSLAIDLRPATAIDHPFISLSEDGMLTLQASYAWDGPSGPALDSRNFMRGSLVHDALYQLMRLGLLDHRKHRHQADTILRDLCREDGMSSLRAGIAYYAVRLFGERHARPRTEPAPAPVCVPGTIGIME
jgi:hypothetical protein